MYQQLREELAKVKTLEGIAAVSQELKLRCQAGAGAGGSLALGGVRARGHDQGLGLLQEEISRQEGAKPTGDLPFHWICQPYIRPG